MQYPHHLRKRKPPRMGVRPDPHKARVNQEHRRFVRSFDCAVKGLDCQGRIEFAHVRSGLPADALKGGTGLKPEDAYGVSLCRLHHAEQHQIGEAAFERRYCISLVEIAEELARQSPALKREE